MCYRFAWALGLPLVLPFISLIARAQDAEPCDEVPLPGPVAVTPASGARGVTLDAPVKVEFTSDYFQGRIVPGDPATDLTLRVADTGQPVPGELQVVGGALFFVPAAELAANTRYQGTATGAEVDLDFEFFTGPPGSLDVSPPRFGGIDEVGSAATDASCEFPKGGVRIDVAFAPATDDGPPGSLEYLLFLTRGQGVNAPELRARRRNFATTGLIPMAFVLEGDRVEDPICVQVHVVDGVGHVNDDTDRVCFDPVQGNFFESLCSVSPTQASGPSPAGVLGALAVLGMALLSLLRSRRTRR